MRVPDPKPRATFKRFGKHKQERPTAVRAVPVRVDPATHATNVALSERLRAATAAVERMTRAR